METNQKIENAVSANNQVKKNWQAPSVILFSSDSIEKGITVTRESKAIFPGPSYHS